MHGVQVPEAFIHLMEASEELYSYTSLDRLRRLARSDPEWAGLTSNLARIAQLAVAEEMLFCDERMRLTRSDEFVRTRVFRLNRRNARVAQVLS